jgi:hypothetical protein
MYRAGSFRTMVEGMWFSLEKLKRVGGERTVSCSYVREVHSFEKL